MQKEKIKILVVSKHEENSPEFKSHKLSENENFHTIYSWKNNLKSSDLKNIDLVISVGGDGTALSASHFLFDKPLLAVNSNPGKSEGALTTIPISELHKKLEEIKFGNYKTEKLERIEVKINEKIIEPIALNEVFLANEKAYHMSRYKIKFSHDGKNEEEKQNSSGIIFSTGTGSTAWFKSAGGEPFSPQSRFIKFLVREPYIWNLHRFQILKRTIHEEEEVEIFPSTEMVLAIDSIREFKLNPEDKVKIKISKYPLIRIK